ncbi:MAG: RNA-binding protein [Thermoplasmata archaeon]|nr:MAG: RNA-binding protein [Thermoplasmata archaeon]
MKNLEDVMKKIEQVLNEKDDLREKALKKCRDIIRECRKGIKKVHNEDIEGARKNIRKAEKILAELKKEIEEHPDIMTAGYMENAMQEVAEAEIFLAIVEDKKLPNPEDINVSYTSYLLGLADVVGELRRRGVYLLKDGSIEDVEKILAMMEEICDKLMEFDYPSGLLPIKRKQDVIKKILEKMRGEVAIFKKSKELENKIEAVLRKLRKKEEKIEETTDIDSLL